MIIQEVKFCSKERVVRCYELIKNLHPTTGYDNRVSILLSIKVHYEATQGHLAKFTNEKFYLQHRKRVFS